MEGCKMEGPKLFPCQFLESHLQRGKVKGIVLVNLMNFETGKRTRTFVVYKDIPHLEGFIFNFCPFCGAVICNEKERKDD